MAKRKLKPTKRDDAVKKKTTIGNSKYTKSYSKGGGQNGSTPSKKYKKKSRGQGRRRRKR
jgi:hypothetical protein